MTSFPASSSIVFQKFTKWFVRAVAAAEEEADIDDNSEKCRRFEGRKSQIDLSSLFAIHRHSTPFDLFGHVTR